MFKNGAPQCRACSKDIDEESARFVSVGKDCNQLESVNKPLVIFFLYSGDDHISDKICLECFDKFKGISQFYAQCKNSRSKYTPCFRDSSKRFETPRILSTETPDLVSTSEFKKRDPSSDLFSSSSSSRSIQSCVSPKTKYLLHHDLGIRLPKHPQRENQCFGETDPCYSLLRSEFDEQNDSKDEDHLEKNKGRKSNFPPLTHRDDRPLMQDTKRHTHVANCPFCPALILKKYSSF